MYPEMQTSRIKWRYLKRCSGQRDVWVCGGAIDRGMVKGTKREVTDLQWLGDEGVRMQRCSGLWRKKGKSRWQGSNQERGTLKYSSQDDESIAKCRGQGDDKKLCDSTVVEGLKVGYKEQGKDDKVVGD